MIGSLKQAWLAPLAGLLVLIQLVLAVALIAGYDEAGNRAIALLVALVSAGSLAAGLWKRPHERQVGNVLIVVGALFNAYWFWTLVLPVLAIFVVVGVVIGESRTPSSASSTP